MAASCTTQTVLVLQSSADLVATCSSVRCPLDATAGVADVTVIPRCARSARPSRGARSRGRPGTPLTGRLPTAVVSSCEHQGVEHFSNAAPRVRRWPTVLLGASLALLAVALTTAAHHHESKIIIATMAVALLVGWLPAAALGRLTFSWSADDSRGPLERAAISGCGTGSGILCGNLLSLEPWSIRLPAAMLAAFLIAGLVALTTDWLTRRRGRRPERQM
jgi:hypothetical protein